MPVLASLAQTDENTLVRAAAITALGKLKASGNMNIFKQALSSQSYAVQGAALSAISKLDAAQALNLAKGFEKDNEGALSTAIVDVYANNGTSAQWPFVYKKFTEGNLQTKFNLARKFATMTANVDNSEDAQQGIEALKKMGLKYKVYGADQFVIGQLEGNIKTQRTKMNDQVSLKAIDEAVKELKEAK